MEKQSMHTFHFRILQYFVGLSDKIQESTQRVLLWREIIISDVTQHIIICNIWYNIASLPPLPFILRDVYWNQSVGFELIKLFPEHLDTFLLQWLRSIRSTTALLPACSRQSEPTEVQRSPDWQRKWSGPPRQTYLYETVGQLAGSGAQHRVRPSAQPWSINFPELLRKSCGGPDGLCDLQLAVNPGGVSPSQPLF